MKYFLLVMLSIAFASCKTDLSALPAFSETKQVQVVVETPAGAAYQNKYDPVTQQFKKVQEAGQDKVIRFLPYPGNAGFIPSTRKPEKNGSGEPLSVLLIAESQPAGTVSEVMPLGVLVLETAGELHYQLIATPAKPSERLIEATEYEEFAKKKPCRKTNSGIVVCKA